MAITSRDNYTHGYMGETPERSMPSVVVIEGLAQRIHTVRVADFTVSDVEDPDLYVAVPLLKWQHSEAGSWIMEHAVETPMWHRTHDYTTYGYRYAVTAKLKEEDYLVYRLKYE